MSKSIAELQKEVVAEKQRILAGLGAAGEPEPAAAEAKRAAAAVAAKAARNAQRAANAAAAAERRAAREALRAERKAARGPTPTRRRGAGANWEIAGRPAHLGPGAKLRSVARKGTGPVTRRVTRAMAKRGSKSRSGSR